MTVKELRQLLFDVKNQDAKVVVILPEDIVDGHVKKTHEVVARRTAPRKIGSELELGHLVLGHPEDPADFLSILTN